MNLQPTGRDTFISWLIMLVVATVAVILRFIAKASTRQKVAVEDYLIAVALVVFYVYTIHFLIGERLSHEPIAHSS
jgi:multisubunit Na+/H+ antiporter MnhF subunit